MDECHMRKSFFCPMNGLFRGINPNASIIVGELTEISSSPAANIDNSPTWTWGNQMRDQPGNDSASGDKPPVGHLNL